MKEEQLIVIDSVAKEEPGVLFVPATKRRKRKPRGRGLLFLLLVGVTVFLGIKFSPLLKDFLKYLPYDDNNMSDLNSSTNSAPSDNKDDTETTDEEKTHFDFISTYPSKAEIIVEATGSINTESLNFPIPTVEEIYSVYGIDAPIVLITSFSPTEGFSNGEGYTVEDEFYSSSKNVEELGAYICNKLNENGINSIHMKEYAPVESLYESRIFYEKQINDILNEHPSILYIFDISRKIDYNNDMSINKPYASIDDLYYPAIELTVGTYDGVITNLQRRSIYFAKELSSFVNASANNLIYKTVVSKYDLIQDFDAICMRIDIGSFGHTFTEASESADILASLICDFLEAPE